MEFHLIRGLAAACVLLLPASSLAESPAPPSPSPLRILVRTLGVTQDPGTQLNILRGMNAALKGQRNLPPPEGWTALYPKLAQSPNPELRRQAQTLAVIFGGAGAQDELRKVLAEDSATPDARRAALDALVGARDAATLPLLLGFLRDEASPLRQPAVRALATYDDPQVSGAVLAAYPSLSTEEKRDALATLSMRPGWARALLDAVGAGQLSRKEISAPLARQLQDLHDAEVDGWLAKNWGSVHSTSAVKQQEIARLKAALTPAVMAAGDPSHGRAIFSQTCNICHTLFGVGAKIGPELPGAFQDIDYLLQNIVDPNAIIGKDYQQTVIQLKDGQTLIGIIGSEEGATITLKGLAGPVTIQKADLQKRQVLDVSLMPEGLLTGRSVEDVRDLFAYLGRHGQVPILIDATNANDFFNGHDLSHWHASSAAAWSVEGGAVQGESKESKPEFLTSDMVADGGVLQGIFGVEQDPGQLEVFIQGEEGESGFIGYSLLITASGRTQLLHYAEPGKGVPVAGSAPDRPDYEIGRNPDVVALKVRVKRRTVFGMRVQGDPQIRATVSHLRFELSPK